MRLGRGARKVATHSRESRAAATSSTAALVDQLRRYANALGVAVDIFATQGDPIALDVTLENSELIAVVAKELMKRTEDGVTPYVPQTDEHLAALVKKFNARQRGDTPAGTPPPP